MSSPMILVVNNSFPELNHLAAELSRQGLLSSYVRPYANLGRAWERALMRVPGFGVIYAKSFGRRCMPGDLHATQLEQAGLGWDFVLASWTRLPGWIPYYRPLRQRLIRLMSRRVARSGARAAEDPHARVVVASWGCAEPAFRAAKVRGAVCVLNYSLAHHGFTQRYLQEEAEREPSFAATLNSHDLPAWQVAQLDREIELADHILVGSSFVRDTFLAEGVPGHKLEVVPYGVDTSIFSPRAAGQANDGKFRMVFAGQLSQRKGLSYLLKAYEQIHDDSTSLTLVGQLQDDGSALQPWRHLVRHVPHVPRAQLAAIFRESDVFVFPTLVEGMGLVVIEAMASGLPVITTPNGPCDVVRDGVEGYLVPPRDVNALVARMRQLQRDPCLRSGLAGNAALRARDYTWATYRQEVANRLRAWAKP